jgi:hypothetical protein
MTRFERNPVMWAAGVLLALVLAGCAAAGPRGSVSTPPPAAVEAQGEGGEEPTVVFVDPTGRFSVEHPSSWATSTPPREDVRFTGRDEFISVTIVNTALSAMDFASTDTAALSAATTGYQSQPARGFQMRGATGAVVAFGWEAGPSPVTGKVVPSSAKRYYLPGPGGKLAILTVSSPVQLYDPEGADDLANTFKWL